MAKITEPSFGNWWIERTAEGHTHERTSAELTFALARLMPPTGAKILDVGCNRGRHSLELAKRGFDVTGVDIEPQAIGVAREAAARAGASVEFIAGDMAQLELAGFDAAICIGTSFGFHADDAGDAQQLQHIYHALKPKGTFFLEITSLFAQQYKEYGEARRLWMRQNDLLIFDEGYFDGLTCRAHHTTEYQQGADIRVRREDYRVYAPTEIAKMLTTAGFTIDEVWGDYDGAPFTIHAPSYIARCTK